FRKPPNKSRPASLGPMLRGSSRDLRLTARKSGLAALPFCPSRRWSSFCLPPLLKRQLDQVGFENFTLSPAAAIAAIDVYFDRQTQGDHFWTVIPARQGH